MPSSRWPCKRGGGRRRASPAAAAVHMGPPSSVQTAVSRTLCSLICYHAFEEGKYWLSAAPLCLRFWLHAGCKSQSLLPPGHLLLQLLDVFNCVEQLHSADLYKALSLERGEYRCGWLQGPSMRRAAPTFCLCVGPLPPWADGLPASTACTAATCPPPRRAGSTKCPARGAPPPASPRCSWRWRCRATCWAAC